MIRKMPKPALLALFGGFLLLAVAACNNSGDKKSETTDTPASKPVEKMAPAPMPDTTHMDSANTRPVKTPD